MSSRIYLKNFDKCYCTGVYLRWNDADEYFELDQLEETIYFDGCPVNYDENEKPYIDSETSGDMEQKAEKCYNCGEPICNTRIAAQHGSWSGIFCTNACVQAYEKSHT